MGSLCIKTGESYHIQICLKNDDDALRAVGVSVVGKDFENEYYKRMYTLHNKEETSIEIDMTMDDPTDSEVELEILMGVTEVDDLSVYTDKNIEIEEITITELP